MSAAIPVERYRLEVALVGPADAAVRVYNTRAKIDQEAHATTKSLHVESAIPARTAASPSLRHRR